MGHAMVIVETWWVTVHRMLWHHKGGFCRDGVDRNRGVCQGCHFAGGAGASGVQHRSHARQQFHHLQHDAGGVV
jgi:hypothetical protein